MCVQSWSPGNRPRAGTEGKVGEAVAMTDAGTGPRIGGLHWGVLVKGEGWGKGSRARWDVMA